jgi:hypothetical protein
MTISCEDIQRVALEVMHTTQDLQDQVGEDHRVQADAWAESVGMEEGVMAMVCNGITTAFSTAMAQAALEQMEEGVGETVIADGVEGITIDQSSMEWAMEMTIISAFRWGYETCRQYGVRTEVPS